MKPVSIFTNPQRGSALIITLGVVSVVSLAIILFTLTMRVNRAAAQNARERAQARQDVHSGLVLLMNILVPFQVDGLENDNDPRRVYFYTPPENQTDFASGHAFGSFPFTEEWRLGDERFDIFHNAAPPLFPPRLTNDIANVHSTWFYYNTIVYTNRHASVSPDDTLLQKYRFDGMSTFRAAGLLVNCSGFLPAAANTNILDGAEIRVFDDLLDHLDEDLLETTFHALYDPNPWQFCLYPGISGEPAASLLYDYSQNPWQRVRELSGLPPVSNNVVHAVNLTALTNSIFETAGIFKAGLAYAGFSQHGYNDDALTRLAFNYLNFTSTNRAPMVLEDTAPSRVDHGFNSLPVIAQVVLEKVPLEPDGDTGIEFGYRAGVLVYHPFAPHPSPPEIDLLLTVSTAPVDTSDPRGMSIGNPSVQTEFYAIPPLSHHNPFHYIQIENPICFTSTTPAGETVYHPIGGGNSIYIWPRLVYSPENDSGQHVYDEALLTRNMNGVREWTGEGSVIYHDPRFNLFAPDEFPDNRVPQRFFPPGFTTTTEIYTNDTALVTLLNETLGTPWFFPNRPLLHAAELAYLFDDSLSSTNLILGIDQPHTARLVDCFAAIPPHLHPGSPPAHSNALTRINPNTPFHEILPPLLDFFPTDPALLLYRLDNGELPQPFPRDFVSVDPVTNAWMSALEKTNGRGWNNHAQFLPALAAEFELENESQRRLLNDLLVHVAPQISFRQNAFVVIIQAQRLSPKGRPLATQRAAFTILRDAFTGKWFVYQTTWLTEK